MLRVLANSQQTIDNVHSAAENVGLVWARIVRWIRDKCRIILNYLVTQNLFLTERDDRESRQQEACLNLSKRWQKNVFCFSTVDSASPEEAGMQNVQATVFVVLKISKIEKFIYWNRDTPRVTGDKDAKAIEKQEPMGNESFSLDGFFKIA